MNPAIRETLRRAGAEAGKKARRDHDLPEQVEDHQTVDRMAQLLIKAPGARRVWGRAECDMQAGRKKISFAGMDLQVVVAILGLAAAFFSTLWATGGWSALRRRSIQQELNLMKDLPGSSATRERLTTYVEERIDVYLYQIREQPAQRARRLGIILLIYFFLFGFVGGVFFPDANIVVLAVLESVLLILLAWWIALKVRSWRIKRSRQRHDDLLNAARTRRIQG